MSNPDVSIYVPAIRPQLWERLYESLVGNSVSFEIIFVGHVPPTFTLPSNCQHILSSVKPVQCAEIGFRACKGEFCIYSRDDVFFGDHTLDRLVDSWHKVKNEMVVISCMPYVRGEPISTKHCRFCDTFEQSPPVPVAGLYKRSVLQGVGSRDRNFVASYADLDLAMRFYQMGGCHGFCQGTMANEDYGFYDPNRLIWMGLTYDRPLLEQFWSMTREEYRTRPDKNDIVIRCVHPWFSDRLIVKDRTQPVEPFEEVELVTISQGPKGPEGRWV